MSRMSKAELLEPAKDSTHPTRRDLIQRAAGTDRQTDRLKATSEEVEDEEEGQYPANPPRPHLRGIGDRQAQGVSRRVSQEE